MTHNELARISILFKVYYRNQKHNFSQLRLLLVFDIKIPVYGVNSTLLDRKSVV